MLFTCWLVAYSSILLVYYFGCARYYSHSVLVNLYIIFFLLRCCCCYSFVYAYSLQFHFRNFALWFPFRFAVRSSSSNKIWAHSVYLFALTEKCDSRKQIIWFSLFILYFHHFAAMAWVCGVKREARAREVWGYEKNRIWIHYNYCLKFKEWSFIKSNEIILHFMCSNAAAEQFIFMVNGKKKLRSLGFRFGHSISYFILWQKCFFLLLLLLLVLIDNIHLPIINSIENFEDFELVYTLVYYKLQLLQMLHFELDLHLGIVFQSIRLMDICLKWRNNVRTEQNKITLRTWHFPAHT